MIATPSPLPAPIRPRRLTPLDELGESIDGAREEIARVEAMLPREDRDRDRGERQAQ
jgi:hypothetical protein